MTRDTLDDLEGTVDLRSLEMYSSATAYRRRRKTGDESARRLTLAFDCSAANAVHLEKRRSLSPFYKKQGYFQTNLRAVSSFVSVRALKCNLPAVSDRCDSQISSGACRSPGQSKRRGEVAGK